MHTGRQLFMGTWADLSNFYSGPGVGCNHGSCKGRRRVREGNATDSIYPSSPFSLGGAKAIGAQRGSGRSSGGKERIPVGQRASKFARRRRRRRVSRSRPEISRGIQIKPSSPLLPPRWAGCGVEPRFGQDGVGIRNLLLRWLCLCQSINKPGE